MLFDPSRRLLRHGLLAAAWALSCPAFALGQTVPLDAFFADAPAQITWVRQCGAWHHGGREGRFRVVHAERHAQSFLYVQWMVQDAQGQFEAVATTELPEVNNDHAEILLDRLRCRALKDGIVVTAVAQFGHDQTQGPVRLRAFRQPGQYRFVQSPAAR